MQVQSNEAGKPALIDVPNRFLDKNLKSNELVYHDPVDEDEENDATMELTHRQLLRLIFMAAETGVRFQRDKLSADPVNWFLTPTKLFDGQAPIDACKRHDAFLRGIIVHGLSLGLDVDPNDIAELLADDDGELGDIPTQAAPLKHLRFREMSSA